ncbi:5'-methylthioadenosine/S-adenosylhomocysteine nucleosidase family protein [Chryseobacterium limigenitum]|uniref:Nucleoside phosphorylase n=1 Tax=Chryseobacterium limigenitum TaxID=1612149 RepID=A0A1K2IL91_9FLAO|nr:5'-methylthioadenosine/S-adenosylhomocysteine nucleosidase [Chryseobacterium limigenitum]SFZ92984.1 Nucleoside phosphorylase [Chryseobacterium limigenitum]
MKPILILTALEVERQAIEKHLTNIETENHPATGTDYKKGEYIKGDGTAVSVIVGRTDQTNVNASLETERALEYYKPAYIFFSGVAGGLKDVGVGDIVIGQNVIGIERGKEKKDTFFPRPQFGASSYELERLASNYSTSQLWKNRAKELLDAEFNPEIKVFTGTIASGEKVDASIESDLHKRIEQNASHALAIEMEGLGFLEVCRTRPTVKSLLLRGISDMVEDKTTMDSKGSQPYASQNVSAFLFGVIDNINFGNEQSETPTSKLTEIMTKLYPGGLRENGIWENAGGNLALIPLAQSGKGQWVEAIRILTRGGGGNITAKTLIEAVLQDYAQNIDLLALYKSL